MLPAPLSEFLRMPPLMPLRLVVAVQDASPLAAIRTRHIPRLPATALPMVAMTVGDAALLPNIMVVLASPRLLLLDLGGRIRETLVISPPRPETKDAETAPDPAAGDDGWTIPSPSHNPTDAWGFPHKDDPPPSAGTALAA